MQLLASSSDLLCSITRYLRRKRQRWAYESGDGKHYDEDMEQWTRRYRETRVWDRTSGKYASVLLTQDGSSDDAYEGADDVYWECYQPKFTWLPDSTICCLIPEDDELSLRTASAELISSAKVTCFIEETESWTEGVWVSPCGGLIAGQSGSSLLVLAAPSCSTHLQLALDTCAVFAAAAAAPEGYETCLKRLLWAPDSTAILCWAEQVKHLALCSLASRSWVQVSNSLLQPPAASVLSWSPQGLVCRAGGAAVVLDPTSQAVQHLGPELSVAKGLAYSPDFCWLAGCTKTGIDIFRAKTGQLAARWQVPPRPRTGVVQFSGGIVKWSAAGNALTCGDYVFCFK